MINYFEPIIQNNVGDPKPKKKEEPKYDPIKEMNVLSAKPLKYDNNKTSVEVVKSAAEKTGINPALLFSSAFQEGMNRAIARPDEISEAYLTAKIGQDFPVDGFYNYGLDTFGTKFKKYIDKGYLTEDFASQFHPYEAVNEKGETVTTAAFKNNEAALMAKAAMLRDIQDTVNDFAKQKGVELDENAANYFALVAYNSGEENAQKMMEKYAKAKDKKAFIEKGDVNWQKVHKNISPRMKSMLAALEYFK